MAVGERSNEFNQSAVPFRLCDSFDTKDQVHYNPPVHASSSGSLFLCFPRGHLQCNKYFHIWAGRFAYLAGVVQCYRGLELVSGSDELLFSTFDGLDLEVMKNKNICRTDGA